MAVQRTSLGVAFLVFVYIIAATSGYISHSPLFSPLNAIVIAFILIVYVIWSHTYRGVRPYHANFWHFVPLHLIGMLFPLLISGFMSPMTTLWIVLLVMVDVIYGRLYMRVSAALLILTALMSIATLPASSYQSLTTQAIDHINYASVIILMGWFVSMLRDVSTKQHNEFLTVESKRADDKTRLMTLINSLNEAIVSINSAGVVQLYNASMLSVLDTNQTLTGKKLDDIVKLYDSKNARFWLLKALSSGAPSIIRDDLVYHFKDGESVNIAISSSRVRGDSNETLGYILVLRDITRDKNLDEERDEFISVVSHELRTPITITEGTISNAQLLMKKGATPDVIAGALATAHEQTLYLSRMINDLSTLSRAERGVGSNREHINVQEFVHELYKEYLPKARSAGLKLNLDILGTPGHIKASRLYVEEILQNFLTNAIKYTPNGHIDFIVKVVKDNVVFSVKDTGIGISKSEHNKIFEKFYRAEDYRTRETKGTGLGLYIVQKLAHKVGTQVEIESKLNHGSSFSIRLPLASTLDSKGHDE